MDGIRLYKWLVNHSLLFFLAGALKSLILIKSDMKSRAAGAGSFDGLGIDSNTSVAHKPEPADYKTVSVSLLTA